MARAPDQRVEQARKLYAKGLKLIEIAGTLGVPEGTVRSWKNRYDWDNATLQKNKRNVAKRKAVSRATKMPKGMAEQDRREIRMRLRQESLKLSFLIVWIQKKNG